MNKIPPKLKAQIAKDPFYKKCIHAHCSMTSPCSGRITWEHAWLYAGRQIQEKWAIVPCCEKHNIGVSGIDKLYNQYRALLRATPQELKKYPKKNWQQELQRLKNIFE